MKKAVVAVIPAIWLRVYDCAVTMIFAPLGCEMNPIVRWVFAYYGPMGYAVQNVVGIALALWVYGHFPRQLGRVFTALLLAVVYAPAIWVTAHNTVFLLEVL